MDDLDAIELAEGFHDAPMGAERYHLVEAEHVAAVFDVIHPNLQRGAAASGGRGVNVADYRSGINDKLIDVLEADEGHRGADRP
jgi:hypothetical protein